MIHELKDIIRSAKIAQSKGIKTVLASVVSFMVHPTEGQG